MSDFSKIQGLRVLVLGDLMLDTYDFCFSAESREVVSEKPGKRAYRVRESLKALGGAGNVAANASSLGAQTTLIGMTGGDGFQVVLGSLCSTWGIRGRFIEDHSRPTTLKARIYIDNEYLLRRDHESLEKIGSVTAEKLLDEFSHFASAADVVILSDYNKGLFVPEVTQAVFSFCKLKKIPIIVDCKPPNLTLFRGAQMLAPNDLEALELLPSFAQEKSLQNSMEELYSIVGAETLVVTLGKKGLASFDGKNFCHVPGRKVEAVDPVGAGDTVRAAMALGYASGFSTERILHFANDVAAVSVQKLGTSTVTLEEVVKLREQFK